MIYSETVLCKLCNKQMSKLGLAPHILQTHKMNPELYREQYVYEYRKCGICDKQIIKPKKFCSPRCVNIYRSHRVKEHKHVADLTTHTRYLKKIFSKILQEEKEEIAIFYKNNIITFSDICKKFKISEDILKLILKEYNIKPYNSLVFAKKKRDEKTLNFLKSDTGKKIIKEYQKPGNNIRSISRKYKIYRKTLKNLLILSGVKLKNCKEAKREVDAVKKKKGIRGHRFGKRSPAGSGKCSWYFYDNIKYQGSWEFKVGLWLKSQGIQFLCHKGVRQFKYEIDGNKHTYCPDFYLLKEDYFIEVKGYFSEADKRKIDIFKRTYPKIHLEIYDKSRLEKKNILNIDKQLCIHIEDYMFNYKTDELYINFLKKVDNDELILANIIRKQNFKTLAKRHNVPYFVMCRAFNFLLPKRGTNEFYSFCFHKFFTIDQIKIMEKSKSIKGASQRINNGLSYKRNLEIIRRFKKGAL